jgi:hypothetical protein
MRHITLAAIALALLATLVLTGCGGGRRLLGQASAVLRRPRRAEA